MPVLIPGQLTEQKVVTVANNDTAINAEISTQDLNSWSVSQIIVSGSDVIILFTRTLPIQESIQT